MEKNRIVWDVEGDGLLDTIQNVHCITLEYIDSDNIISLYGDLLTPDTIINCFTGATEIICHNEIAFDIPLIKMFYGVDLIELVGVDAIIDTLLWSQCLYPDRPMPKGCPTSYKCPVTNRTKKIGPHGLEAWGYRVGHKKIEVHDWRYYSPLILERNKVDVYINKLVYFELCKEAGIDYAL